MPQCAAAIARVIVSLHLIFICAQQAVGIGFENFGPSDEFMGRSTDWPKGVEDLLRHKTRVYFRDVNGGVQAYYDGDVDSVNELLALYSQIDLAEHVVVVRPGHPSAESFDGKQTPYVVELDLPSGLMLNHALSFVNSGLYSATPRLTVHVDASLAEHIDELKIPDNLALRELNVRAEDALLHAYDKDVNLRYRAIGALGEVADSSGPALKAVRRAIEDENESVRKAGTLALEQIVAAQEPDAIALRDRLRAFVRQHSRTLDPDALLAVLNESDAQYATGFTAHGTLAAPVLSGKTKLTSWTLTMGDGKLLVQQRDVVDDAHPATEGRSEYTIYSSPERMGTIHVSRLWADGKLIESKPSGRLEPVGSTYELLIGRYLWSLGRGYADTIDRITEIKTSSDGLLDVEAQGINGRYVERWELRIDPSANYLVRSAKAFSRGDEEPAFVVDSAGVFEGVDRSTTHTARWIEGAGQPISIAVTSVTGSADDELIRAIEDRLDDAKLFQ